MRSHQYAKVTATGTVTGLEDRVILRVILNPAAAVCSIVLWDNTSAAGNDFCKLVGAANGGSVESGDLNYPLKIGLHAVLTGAGAEAWVYYE